jgi:hypothetical protein
MGHIEKRCPTAVDLKIPKISFCRFCCNAKKPDYKSHNQFAKDGFVECPVLLAIECQLCSKTGHTKNYCPTLQNIAFVAKAAPVQVPAAPVQVPAARVPAARVPAAPVSKSTNKNPFAVLDVLEEEEECLIAPVVEHKSPVNSWAGRVAKVSAPVKQAPVKQAPVKQAPVKQAPLPVAVKQAPVKQAPVKQAPLPVVVEKQPDSDIYVSRTCSSWADSD